MEYRNGGQKLIDKFMPHAHYWVHDLTPRKEMEEEQLENAVECALIAIDERIDEAKLMLRLVYLYEVRQEVYDLVKARLKDLEVIKKVIEEQ